LGDLLNLSASQAGRRRQRLEAEGYILRLCRPLGPVAQVQLSTYGPDRASGFARLIHTRHEITSAWTMTGEADYLLRVCRADLPALNALIHEVLLPHPAVTRVQSQIVMDQLKRDAPLPT